MSQDSTPAGTTADGVRPRGAVQSEIADAVVRLAKEHLGRGPERARVTVDRDLVVVLLHNGLGSAERLLLQAGRSKTVGDFRRAVQDVLRPALVDEVQRITGRRVTTFMSANAMDPDVAAEIFLLDGPLDRGESVPGDTR